MQVRDVKRLMDAMAAADLTELEFEQRDGEGSAVFKVRLRRERELQLAAAPAARGEAAEPQGRSALPAPGEAAGAAETPAPQPLHRPLVDVIAPIVGTFYGSPAPDSPPYVRLGDRVERGSVLCIIEAMKLMNEIEADVSGTISEVLVENEDPVEYGQVLFRIDPS